MLPQAQREIAEIHYQYSVDGKNYTGYRYSPSRERATEPDWLRMRLRGELGNTVDICYDPRDPADSYLTHGYEPPSTFKCIVLASFGLLGMGLICYEIRNIRRFNARRAAASAAENKNEKEDEHPERESEKQNP